MNTATKEKTEAPTIKENLQASRAYILQEHLHQSKDEKENEIKRIKEEINKLKHQNETPSHAEQEREEYAELVEKILFEFRNEINSPINSIEYAGENLKKEYDRLLVNIVTLSNSAYPTEALERAVNYVNGLTTVAPQNENTLEFRERKKTFGAILDEYNIINSKRAAEYFVLSGVFYVDDELYWIMTQPKGDTLFEIMISLLSIRQSFEVLNSSKTRTRFLTSNLIIPSDKEFHRINEEKIKEEEKKTDVILKRKFMVMELMPVVKMIIILLNLFVIFKIIFRF